MANKLKFMNKLWQKLTSLFPVLNGNGPTDDDFDQMRSWSISAQLAAVPSGYLEQVPLEVAALIRAAKELHQEMESGAAARDARCEPCPDLG